MSQKIYSMHILQEWMLCSRFKSGTKLIEDKVLENVVEDRYKTLYRRNWTGYC